MTEELQNAEERERTQALPTPFRRMTSGQQLATSRPAP
jgi:hypothetical protein